MDADDTTWQAAVPRLAAALVARQLGKDVRTLKRIERDYSDWVARNPPTLRRWFDRYVVVQVLPAGPIEVHREETAPRASAGRRILGRIGAHWLDQAQAAIRPDLHPTCYPRPKQTAGA